MSNRCAQCGDDKCANAVVSCVNVDILVKNL